MVIEWYIPKLSPNYERPYSRPEAHNRRVQRFSSTRDGLGLQVPSSSLASKDRKRLKPGIILKDSNS